MAAPNPESELDSLGVELEKVGLPKVLVLAGPSDFFRVTAFDLAVAAVPGTSELRRMDGAGDGAKTDGRELLELRGAGLFAKGTVLAVRRAKAWLDAHGPELLEVMPQIADGCGVILEVPKLDMRTKFAKSLAQSGRVVEFRELYAEPFDRKRSPLDGELVGWVVTRARKAGLTMSREAAFLLVTVVGKDPGELAPEIASLADRLQSGGSARGGRRSVDVADLRASGLDARFESTPFEFVEALLSDDRVRTLRSLDAMIARGVKSRDGGQVDADGVFPFLTSWLYTSLVQAHHARCLVDSGEARIDEVARVVGVRGFADRFRDTVARHPQARLRRGLMLLRSAQRRLRSTGEEPRRLLEELVAQWFAGRRPSPEPAASQAAGGGYRGGRGRGGAGRSAGRRRG